MREFELIRSSRKTLAIEIKGEKLIVRAPLKTPQKSIERFVAGHEDWISRHLSENAEKAKRLTALSPLSESELKDLANKARETIPKRVEYYAEIMGLTYGRITIRRQRSKWGSCSGKGNLNFNCLLLLTPPEVMDCVIVHELCHLIEMNHSKRFYEQLRKYYPDCDACRKWLKENGAYIMARLKNT